MSRRKFGAARRLPSGRWQARYPRSDGRFVPAPETFGTKTEASRFLAAVETDIARGQWTDPRRESPSLRDFSEEWMRQRTVRGRPLAPRTIDTYRHSLSAWVLPMLGDTPVDRVTPSLVRRWHAHVSGTAGSTAVRQAYAVLRAVLNTAVADELLQSNAKAGLPGVHFHDLRHAGLTLTAQAGATLAEVMRRAGHSSAAAALRYQHAADRRDAVIASRLSVLAAERSAEKTSDDAPGCTGRRGMERPPTCGLVHEDPHRSGTRMARRQPDESSRR